jgi:hypothetical protein
VTVNGRPVAAARILPGRYLPLSRAWAAGDVVEVAFPPTLWAAPLNDYHAAHNATLAFMYGPLVLAGVGLDSDLWVPGGGAFGGAAGAVGSAGAVGEKEEGARRGGHRRKKSVGPQDAQLVSARGVVDPQDPSRFIARNSSDGSGALDFEAVGADGARIRMRPLKDVVDER